MIPAIRPTIGLVLSVWLLTGQAGAQAPATPAVNADALLRQAPRLTGAYIVSSVSGTSPATDRHKSARIEQPVQLYLALKTSDRRWICATPKIQVQGQTHKAIPWDDGTWGQPTIRWSKVEPYPWHIVGPPPDKDVPDDIFYANAAAFGSPRQYQWLGLDPIEYYEAPVPAGDNQWRLIADAVPSFPAAPRYQGLGTMRYRVACGLYGRDATQPVQLVASAGVDATDTKRVIDKVHRVTLRLDDSFLGQLTGYFNVPSVFGSVPDQVDRYLGTDCADLLVGSLRALRGRSAMEYTNVARLRQRMQPLGDSLYMGEDGQFYSKADLTGEPARIPLTTDLIYDGCLITFSLQPDPETWFHIGGLALDLGPEGQPDGQLGPQDIVLHVSRAAVQLDALGKICNGLGQPARIQAFRWRQAAK